MPATSLATIGSHERLGSLNDVHELLRGLRKQRPWFEMKRRFFSEDRRPYHCIEHAAVLEALQRRDLETAREAMLTI